MKINKSKTRFATYSDKLLDDAKFREKFDGRIEDFGHFREDSELRHKAHLTQEEAGKEGFNDKISYFAL